MPTKPTVCIVESLGFLEEESHREGHIIGRTLQLSGKRSAYVYIRNVEELAAVVREFGESDHRYLHLSCHGALDKEQRMVGLALTTDVIKNEDLVALLAPHLAGRRLFLSSCRAARSELPELLLERSSCRSVVAPMSEINFDDAAVFWTAFYHLMFKSRWTAMRSEEIEETVRVCSALVKEEFKLFLPKSSKGAIKQIRVGPGKRRSRVVQ